MAVAEAAVGLVGELGEVVEAGSGPQGACLVVAHQGDIDAEGLLHGDVGPQRPEVLLADADQVTGFREAGRGAEDLGRVLEHGQGPPGHGGQRGDAVGAADDAARLAAAARAHGVALEH